MAGSRVNKWNFSRHRNVAPKNFHYSRSLLMLFRTRTRTTLSLSLSHSFTHSHSLSPPRRSVSNGILTNKLLRDRRSRALIKSKAPCPIIFICLPHVRDSGPIKFARATCKTGTARDSETLFQSRGGLIYVREFLPL